MLPVTLARHLSGAETVRGRGWQGLKNGDLIRQAEASGFAVLVTADHSLARQQHIAAFRIGVLVLPTSKLDALLERLPDIENALAAVRPGTTIELS
jgi:alkanesulfonate monooxygenase SsuD/methylene tetrahydromethanopterin reductase-like flavin-dependent oxidoreductase (luciferase family)